MQLNTTGNDVLATVSLTADTNWHYVNTQRNGSLTVEIYVDGEKYTDTTTGTGTKTGSGVNTFVIGNNNALNTQVFAVIDELIVEQTNWSLQTRLKHYTQAKGRFCI